ncbi:cell wall-binding repeat-containing protein [Desulfosporosinus sp. SYSU MS00001]|uniref:cell wall-binding repeat-containing protein n=1 Tax=Desulfosporosinus sp. SYSU MS00001 TaxID=3416284 RepID=UPI003CF9D5B2
MSKKMIASIIIVCNTMMAGFPVYAATNNSSSDISMSQSVKPNRLAGKTKYETAKAISEYYCSGKVDNVILATGNNFADGISASVLAHTKEAPILLVNSTVENSQDAFDYIRQHLDPSGTVYIIGGTGIIGNEFEAELNELGITKIVRIAGLDRYDTSYQIAESLHTARGSSIVISSGEDYSDALSISSFAANKDWPILLSPAKELPEELKNYLQEQKPAKVFVTGGEVLISNNVISEIRDLLPEASIERLMGQSRFDTNVIIAKTFVTNPATVYLANGYGFADALAGSAVAAQKGEPIIMVDPSISTLPKSTAGYFENFFMNNLSPDLVAFGGNGVVSDEIMANSKRLISGAVKGTSIYSIDDLNQTVTQNESYSLPTTVPAKLFNSDIESLPVQWNPQTVDTSKVGTTVYTGVIDGVANPIKLNLTVREPLPIAQYTTYFDPGLANRTENIRLAAKALDGKLLAPGERFSFNKSVGERTTEAGYKEALIIEGDSFTPGLGGGVCQVSSTLYNAVILAGLEIIERHRHTLPISYVPPGQDATVAYPELDFKFENNTAASILIRSFVGDNSLTFKLYKK